MIPINPFSPLPLNQWLILKFDALYSGCIIKCKIDKDTNRVIRADFYTPFVIDADINVLFSNVIATIYMSYERDYTITY